MYHKKLSYDFLFYILATCLPLVIKKYTTREKLSTVLQISKWQIILNVVHTTDDRENLQRRILKKTQNYKLFLSSKYLFYKLLSVIFVNFEFADGNCLVCL